MRENSTMTTLEFVFRNQFICKNFGILFNDYSRNLKELFSAICEKHGAKDGFQLLCQDPMIIRMGMK